MCNAVLVSELRDQQRRGACVRCNCATIAERSSLLQGGEAKYVRDTARGLVLTALASQYR